MNVYETDDRVVLDAEMHRLPDVLRSDPHGVDPRQPALGQELSAEILRIAQRDDGIPPESCGPGCP